MTTRAELNELYAVKIEKESVSGGCINDQEKIGEEVRAVRRTIPDYVRLFGRAEVVAELKAAGCDVR